MFLGGNCPRTAIFTGKHQRKGLFFNKVNRLIVYLFTFGFINYLFRSSCLQVTSK